MTTLSVLLSGRSARHPLKKIPAVDEVASTLAFLHSEAAACITGQVLKVDSGLSQLRLNS